MVWPQTLPGPTYFLKLIVYYDLLGHHVGFIFVLIHSMIDKDSLSQSFYVDDLEILVLVAPALVVYLHLLM